MSKEWIGLTTPEGRGVWVRASEVEAVVDTKDAREVWTAAGAYDVREPIGDVLAALGVGAVPAAPDGPFAGVKFHTFVDGSILDEGWAEVRCADGRKFRFRVSGDGHPAEPATEPAPGSEEDWREALRVVQEVEPGATLGRPASGPDIREARGGLALWQDHERFYSIGGRPHLTATAAARAYVASRRADPTPGPLVVDGWTLDLDRWARPLPLSGDHGKHDVEAVIFERSPEGVKWWAVSPVKRRWDAVEAGIAPTRADALAAATAALRAHYGRPA